MGDLFDFDIFADCAADLEGDADPAPGSAHDMVSAPGRLHVEVLLDLLIGDAWTVEQAREAADHYTARAEWWRLHRGHGEPVGAVRITTARWSGLYVPVSAQGAPCDLPGPGEVPAWGWPEALPTVAPLDTDEDPIPF
ncbi:MAG: hypothetical protein EKK55_12940 [Rhodocyclaceae bacterium]|nr:MAG: hypothetical protein EKK55_12940 [Rhodocyclaceae bacterium]